MAVPSETIIRSSHWQHPNWFGTLKSSPLMRPVQWWERRSYRRVSGELPAYGAVWKVAQRIMQANGFSPTFDVWKSVMIVALLESHLGPELRSRILLIGDGCGFLGLLIHERWRPEWLGFVDLPEQLEMQRLMVPFGRFFEPMDVLQTEESFSLAINVASMQEMTREMIAEYFSLIRLRGAWFYCLNRVEKRLKGGEVIRFNEYPWLPEDLMAVDEKCPFYTHVYDPWRHPFDGDHWHRLARLYD